MKKLLFDSCTKTAFSFDNVLNEQCDGVSMGSSLGPVLVSIILTEFENVLVEPLIETGVLKFYCRYVDDTIVMIKKDKIQHVLNSFNSFDKNLRFTVNTFHNGNIHFLDIKILNNGETDIYIKDISTGFMFNITAMNTGTQKLLGYAHCMIEHRKFAATNSYL